MMFPFLGLPLPGMPDPPLPGLPPLSLPDLPLLSLPDPLLPNPLLHVGASSMPSLETCQGVLAVFLLESVLGD